jgi:acyl-CoA synthetase (AMP-forming)/AMP-acid ligase II
VNGRDEERRRLREGVTALIERLADGGRDDAARDALLLEVLAWQRRQVAPYARIVDGAADAALLSAPAVPTDVFRFTRVAAHDPTQDAVVFRTSGTTAADRGTHALRDLFLYDRAARAAARHALFCDREQMRLLILAPRAEQARDSSLSYMLSRFDAWFGQGRGVFAWRGDARSGSLDVQALVAALSRAQDEGEPLAVLGTSFAFVHADEALGEQRFRLPAGSRVMQTGGFKGRSREVEPSVMRALIAARFGVPESHVVAEYGMTELSSQMYETTLRQALRGEATHPAAPRRLWIPGWVRATPVDPERLSPLPEGEVGILRIDDLANLDTACAIQTSDLAQRVGDGIELLGRAPGAVPRGCSIAVDAALGAR